MKLPLIILFIGSALLNWNRNLFNYQRPTKDYRKLEGNFSPDMKFYTPNYIKRNELYEMMNPLYQLNAMMSPFYRMYGMDPMNAVTNPYLMGNYQNPYMYNGVLPISNNQANFNQVSNKQRNLDQNQQPPRQPPMYSYPSQIQSHTNSGFGDANQFNIGNPQHTFAAFQENGPRFSNNMPINGIMNPFINTAGMMNPFMNRSGINPYYALTGQADTMLGSPFNNFGEPSTGKGLLYRLSAMNPFILGNLGIGNPFLNSGISPSNPLSSPTDNHNDLAMV